MLSDSIRILNFDNSLLKQKNLLECFQPTIVDLTDVGPQARLWLNGRVTEKIRIRLNPAFKHSITFLGSGDFHQITSLLIEQFEEPISVIVFDHHPDWDTLPPKLHCGSWVTETLRRKNIQKLILLGVSSNDLSSPFIQSGNLSSLTDDRVEIYPYSHGPTKTFFKKVPENKSIKVKRGFGSNQIYWRELRNQNLTEFFFQVIHGIETPRVYVSIDKDCLKAHYSLTNWEEGCFELAELLTLLHLIKENFQIVGLDIVGDYSEPRVQGFIKHFLEVWDRPKDFTAQGQPEDRIALVNEQTNLRILEVLQRKRISLRGRE